MVTTRRLADLDEAPHAPVFPGESPTTVRLSLDEGERVERHSHPGHDVVVAVLDGRVELDVDDETHALRAGDAARFDGERPVSPVAVESTTALVVLAPRPD